MPYQIYDIRNTPITRFEYYFLDSNVLIYLYEESNISDWKWQKYVKPYTDFVDNIIDCYDPPNNNPKPKIILTSLLLAEFINAFMHKVSFKAFNANWRGSIAPKFKEDFRSSNHYSRDLNSLISNLNKLFELGCIEILDDNFTKLKPFSHLLPVVNAQSDFNDLYYYTLLKNRADTAIVTNDGDFKFPDFPIVTLHGDLLSL